MPAPPDMQPQLDAAAQAIRASTRLTVLTGAGVSRESGIPTFRDALEGLWAQYDPQLLATPGGFRRNPKLVWDWYAYRRTLLADARPNPGHDAIAALEQHVPHVVVITQNIDGLHNVAGSQDVIPVHGDLRLNKCFANCQGDPTLIDVDAFEWDRANGPPRCPHCGAYVRPAVIWFEERLPEAALTRAMDLCHTTGVMLVVGTSGTVYPVAAMPRLAARHGATIVEVNPERTPISAFARWHLAGPSGEILPRLVAALTALQDESHVPQE